MVTGMIAALLLTGLPIAPWRRIAKRQSARIRRVGAQLLAGQASYMQRVLTTDPSAQPEFCARLSNHDNARICRGQVERGSTAGQCPSRAID